MYSTTGASSSASSRFRVRNARHCNCLVSSLAKASVNPIGTDSGEIGAGPIERCAKIDTDATVGALLSYLGTGGGCGIEYDAIVHGDSGDGPEYVYQRRHIVRSKAEQIGVVRWSVLLQPRANRGGTVRGHAVIASM